MKKVKRSKTGLDTEPMLDKAILQPIYQSNLVYSGMGDVNRSDYYDNKDEKKLDDKLNINQHLLDSDLNHKKNQA